MEKELIQSANPLVVDAIINNVETKDLRYVMLPIGESYEYITLDLTNKDDLLVFIEYLKTNGNSNL